ncbi:MAG: HAD-IA family hydrolase [Deltaproteobacteria bacterium]|nr:HAD-IA family hydrolase [Deltaproteobacteria bacterium]MBW1952071.1 HAD-IA family hydrolase [Deltaproteobacteria bacterium]MBW1986997.1 HAD-IA family hydrolase [Deltaproteobacteria bacterium]MBW2134046.1 HAD-IA family hydrolase [Deltaproteobacteria bacterium]
MTLKVVAFDCDGVLFDSRQANIAFYNQILRQFNRPLMSPEAVDYVHSHTARESLLYLFQDDPQFEAVWKYYRTMDYRPFISYMVREPFLMEFLDFLRPGYGTAVATNRSTTTKAVFQHHQLEAWFDLVVSAQDVTHPKPHPESFHRILKHFRVAPTEAVYIGDSLVDQEFARNAGVRLIAYRNPQLQADFYLDSFVQGPALIQKLATHYG